jgi:hypothetical protein
VLSQRDVAFSQGAYFLATGLWPLLHMDSFEAMTCSRMDKWLVRTIGVMVGVTGGVLLRAAARNRVTPEVSALGVAASASLGSIDTFYAIRGYASRIYLADSAVHGAFVAGWAQAHDAAPEVRHPAPTVEPPKF